VFLIISHNMGSITELPYIEIFD